VTYERLLPGVASPARRFARVLLYFRDEGFDFDTAWAEAFWRTFYGWEGSEVDADRWGDILTRHRTVWPEQWHDPGCWGLLVLALERIERNEREGISTR
jgi:hypothetical protein